MPDSGTKNKNFPLQDRNLWLTRPLYQAATLQDRLQALGARVLQLPMIEICALDYDTAIKARIMNLDQYDMVFFISTNAARLGMECIMHFWPQYPAGLQNFAVGPTTAEVLAEYDLPVHYPRERMSSEALLALPELKEIQGRKALIVRGVGGREILAEGLCEKGAVVDYAELYRRDNPVYPAEFLQECLLRQPPDGIVITSAEALQNFVTTFSPYWPQMDSADLFVSSERIRDEARSLGFKRITVMPGANDATILESLRDYFG